MASKARLNDDAAKYLRGENRFILSSSFKASRALHRASCTLATFALYLATNRSTAPVTHAMVPRAPGANC